MAIQFDHSCFAISVLIHNVSLSRNVAKNLLFSGGNIIVQNFCTTGNSMTISRSTVEFGAGPVGGGIINGIPNRCRMPIFN